MTNQRKYQLFIACLVLLISPLLLSNFSKTFSEFKKSRNYQNRLDSFSKQSRNTQQYATPYSIYSQDLSSSNFWLAILSEINGISKKYNVKVERANDYKEQNYSEHQSIINEIILSGNLRDIIKLIYSLEYSKKYVAITSTEIYTHKEYGQKNSKLFCKLTFQHLVK